MNPITRMMKRYIKMPLKYALPLLFIGALVLSATTGCTSPTPTTVPADTAVPTTSGGGSTAKAPTSASKTPTTNPNVVNGMEFHAKAVANPPQALGSGGYIKPDPGNVYVAFDCSVKNINAPTYSNTRIGETYWQLRDKVGNVYDPAFLVSGTPGVKVFTSTDSKPGDIVSGYVFFEVPANHGAWKSISYDDGGRDVTITL